MPKRLNWLKAKKQVRNLLARRAVVCCLFLPVALLTHQSVLSAETGTPKIPLPAASTPYRLGPEDSLLIHVKDEPEIPDGPYQVDLNGDLRVPELGTLHVTGTTLDALAEALTERCTRLLKAPVIHVSVAEYRSQRVSILGSVANAGVQQIRGRKTLYEVISDAGGLRPDAGGSIQISRRADEGPLPLADAEKDTTGRFEVGHVDVHDLLEARAPAMNIAVAPNDVITVPRAALVYVLGAVRRPGGFELVEKQNMSVMQALSLAGGTERAAGIKHARILHPGGPDHPKSETAIDLSLLIAGKQPDVLLQPRDILVVPESKAKAASFRMLEALVSTGTGVAIYHPY